MYLLVCLKLISISRHKLNTFVHWRPCVNLAVKMVTLGEVCEADLRGAVAPQVVSLLAEPLHERYALLQASQSPHREQHIGGHLDV